MLFSMLVLLTALFFSISPPKNMKVFEPPEMDHSQSDRRPGVRRKRSA